MVDVRSEGGDALHGGPVDAARFLVSVVMRHIGRDHHEGLAAAPQALDHLGDLCHIRRADGERHERELAENLLQEGQLHLERVLEGVRRVARDDLREPLHRPAGAAVDRHRAERRGEGVRARQREAAHRDAMHRTEHDDAPHDAARRGELVIGARGHRPRIDVAGVRHDKRLRKAQTRREVLYAAEQIVELGSERARIAGVEHPGYGGRAHASHRPYL